MERHFSEQEVTQVIVRASELQERLAPQDDAGRPHGVRESELVRIATELGLEERFVRDAIKDPATFAPIDRGGPASMDRTLERTGPGLPESEAFEIALDEFGPTSGIQSGPTTVGDTMTYQSMAGMSHCEMLVSKKGGRTRVKVGVSTFLPVITVGLPVLMASAIIGGVVGKGGGPAIGWAIGLAGVVGSWLLVRAVNVWSNRKVVEKLDALMARLQHESHKVSQGTDGE
jgi:hypothetical protein